MRTGEMKERMESKDRERSSFTEIRMMCLEEMHMSAVKLVRI
jgi:hypothetical protein